jgi:hypothetical protein
MWRNVDKSLEQQGSRNLFYNRMKESGYKHTMKIIP